MNTSRDEMMKKLDSVSSILKKQNTLIENIYETVKTQEEEIREGFLKNMAKFELFLERNGMENDAFKKQLTSFLSDANNADKFESLLQEYENVKKEVRRQGDTDLTEEEIVVIMKKIKKSQHQQDVINRICDW